MNLSIPGSGQGRSIACSQERTRVEAGTPPRTWHTTNVCAHWPEMDLGLLCQRGEDTVCRRCSCIHHEGAVLSSWHKTPRPLKLDRTRQCRISLSGQPLTSGEETIPLSLLFPSLILQAKRSHNCMSPGRSCQFLSPRSLPVDSRKIFIFPVVGVWGGFFFVPWLPAISKAAVPRNPDVSKLLIPRDRPLGLRFPLQLLQLEGLPPASPLL